MPYQNKLSRLFLGFTIHQTKEDNMAAKVDKLIQEEVFRQGFVMGAILQKEINCEKEEM